MEILIDCIAKYLKFVRHRPLFKSSKLKKAYIQNCFIGVHTYQYNTFLKTKKITICVCTTARSVSSKKAHKCVDDKTYYFDLYIRMEM